MIQVVVIIDCSDMCFLFLGTVLILVSVSFIKSAMCLYRCRRLSNWLVTLFQGSRHP